MLLEPDRDQLELLALLKCRAKSLQHYFGVIFVEVGMHSKLKMPVMELWRHPVLPGFDLLDHYLLGHSFAVDSC